MSELLALQRRGMAAALGVKLEDADFFVRTGFRSAAEQSASEQAVAEATYAGNIAVTKARESAESLAEAQPGLGQLATKHAAETTTEAMPPTDPTVDELVALGARGNEDLVSIGSL